MKKRFKIFIICTFILLLGCNNEPKYQKYTEIEPSVEMLEGTWSLVLDKATSNYIEKYIDSTPKESAFTLYRDNRFICNNLVVVNTFWEKPIKIVNCQGKWKLSKFYHWEVDLVLPDGFGYTLHLRGKGPYYLTVTDDPDMPNETLVFEKADIKVDQSQNVESK